MHRIVEVYDNHPKYVQLKFFILYVTAHKNIKLVIMHGGLMGLYETIDVGVPVIGLPLFFDQQRNMQNLVSKGAALRLQIDKITKNHFLESIRRVIGDKR